MYTTRLSSLGKKDETDSPLPIAEILRRRKGGSQQSEDATTGQVYEANNGEEIDDIDEEIRRLEAELNEDSDGDDNSSSHVSGEEESKEDADQGVICLSSVAKDRIEALPPSCLPSNKRRVLKGIDGTGDVEELKKKRKKQKPVVDEGLKAAVQVVLGGYVARSNEKLPFYCRVCAKQYNNDEEFFEHKKTDFHRAAVEMEKKASYCKLCRKQLTSPVQLKEHLNSKPHKDRLQMLRGRQQQQQRKR